MNAQVAASSAVEESHTRTNRIPEGGLGGRTNCALTADKRVLLPRTAITKHLIVDYGPNRSKRQQWPPPSKLFPYIRRFLKHSWTARRIVTGMPPQMRRRPEPLRRKSSRWHKNAKRTTQSRVQNFCCSGRAIRAIMHTSYCKGQSHLRE